MWCITVLETHYIRHRFLVSKIKVVHHKMWTASKEITDLTRQLDELLLQGRATASEMDTTELALQLQV